MFFLENETERHSGAAHNSRPIWLVSWQWSNRNFSAGIPKMKVKISGQKNKLMEQFLMLNFFLTRQLKFW